MEIKLSKAKYKGSISLEECIFKRISNRNFKDEEIDIEKISQLLWAGQGKNIYLRTVPSAGAIYPLELYVILKNKGIYHYNNNKNSLDLKMEGNFAEKLAEISWNQVFISKVPLNIVICADFSKIQNRYGPERGIRYTLIEVGHCAQNIHLQAVALGLGSVPIGAFRDKKVKQFLELPENLDPLYIIPIGYPI